MATRTSCDYCSNVHKKPKHELCPVKIDGANGKGGPWYCYCAELRPELHPKVSQL